MVHSLLLADDYSRNCFAKHTLSMFLIWEKRVGRYHNVPTTLFAYYNKFEVDTRSNLS